MDLQRALIHEEIVARSGEWIDRQRAVQQEANRKRSEAMRGLPHVEKGEHRKENVTVPKEPPHSSHPTRAAEARVSSSTQARAEWLRSKRPDLARVVAAWPSLPAEVKARISTLVDATRPQGR